MDPVDECSDLEHSEECLWNDRYSKRWMEVVNAWDWRQRSPGEWSKSGDCPRCGHEMSVLVRGSVILGGEAIERETMEPVLAICNCGDSHSGRPTGFDRGCGQRALIDPPDV